MQRPSLPAVLALALLSAPAAANGQEPGSVLVMPVFESGSTLETILAVTNTDEDVFGGGIGVKVEMVTSSSFGCTEDNFFETLPPADTLTRTLGCQLGGSGTKRGYVVVTALREGTFVPVSHDHLIGSVLVLSAKGTVYSVPALSFASPRTKGAKTDVDKDGRRDFDGIEYEGVPDQLLFDSFLASSDMRVALLGLPSSMDTVVAFYAYNDDGWAFSATYSFRCFAYERLEDVSLIFDQGFLSQNVQNDPYELDLDCDGRDDVETGWFRVHGTFGLEGGKLVANPAILGALTQKDGYHGMARLPWRRGTRTTGAY